MTKRATVVEFIKDAKGCFRPFSLTVIEGKGCTIYDIEHSRKYGYIFDQSGFGCSGPVKVSGPYYTTGTVRVEETPCQLVDPQDEPPWRSEKTMAIRERNRTRRLKALPRAFAVAPKQDILDWLTANAIEDEAVWCATCRDWLPSECLCEHVWWCQEIGWWSTPSERCNCKNSDVCDG